MRRRAALRVTRARAERFGVGAARGEAGRRLLTGDRRSARVGAGDAQATTPTRSVSAHIRGRPHGVTAVRFSLMTPSRLPNVLLGITLTTSPNHNTSRKRRQPKADSACYDRRNEHEQSQQCAPLSILPVKCLEIRTHRINRQPKMNVIRTT